jgi:hypothetical protein
MPVKLRLAKEHLSSLLGAILFLEGLLTIELQIKLKSRWILRWILFLFIHLFAHVQWISWNYHFSFD